MAILYLENIEIIAKIPIYFDLIKKLEEIEPEPFIIPDQFNSDDYIESIIEYNGLHNLSELRSVVILGFEIGLIARFLLKHCAITTHILIVDTDLRKFKYVLMYYDLRDVLRDSRIILGIDQEKSIKNKLHNLNIHSYAATLTNRIHYVDQLIYHESNLNYTSGLKEMFIQVRTTYIQALGNSADDTIKGIRNIIHNVRNTVDSYPIDKLKNMYTNTPAVCVAAGPSLEKNIAVLKKMKENVLIIACDTIVDRLMNEGIIPDVISSMERDETVYESFYRGKIFSKTTLYVGISLVDPRIFYEFPGPKAVVSPPGMPLGRWLEKTISGMTFLDAGKSVAHLNYSLATFLGCEPIILIGQDLAYGDSGTTHAVGTYEDNEIVKEHPELMVHNFEKQVLVPGFYGEPVWTNRWWVMFRQIFEEKIEAYGNKVINATEGGSHIEGAEHMSLQEVFDLYCKEKLSIPRPNEIEYNHDSQKYSQIIDSLIEKVEKELLKENREQQKKLKQILIKMNGLIVERNWQTNKGSVLSKITTIHSDILKTVSKDTNLTLTIQYANFMYKSKMNRLIELSEFSHIQLVHTYLSDFMAIAIEFAEKLAELYELLLKQLLADRNVKYAEVQRW